MIRENSRYFSTFNFIFKPRRSRFFSKGYFPLKNAPDICHSGMCCMCETCECFITFPSLSPTMGGPWQGIPCCSASLAISLCSLRGFIFQFSSRDWMELLDSERCDHVAARFDGRFINIFHLLIVIATASRGPTLYLALGV